MKLIKQIAENIKIENIDDLAKRNFKASLNKLTALEKLQRYSDMRYIPTRSKHYVQKSLEKDIRNLLTQYYEFFKDKYQYEFLREHRTQIIEELIKDDEQLVDYIKAITYINMFSFYDDRLLEHILRKIIYGNLAKKLSKDDIFEMYCHYIVNHPKSVNGDCYLLFHHDKIMQVVKKIITKDSFRFNYLKAKPKKSLNVKIVAMLDEIENANEMMYKLEDDE